jgi:hypothetical protein
MYLVISVNIIVIFVKQLTIRAPDRLLKDVFLESNSIN